MWTCPLALHRLCYYYYFKFKWEKNRHFNFIKSVKVKKINKENKLGKRDITMGGEGVNIMAWKHWLNFKCHGLSLEVKSKKLVYTSGWNKNWYSHYGDQYGSSLKKLQKAIIWSSNTIPGHISREKHNLKQYIHLNVNWMFIAAPFTIASTWK